MDDTTALGAELSKINFLLENLYALVLRDMGAGAEHVAGIADEMRRQLTDLPADVHGSGPADTDQLQEVAAQRLDMFWARVRDRLASAQSD
ncbi:hypothetical protein [Sphingomonas sp.]|uniref:hypothetical protein n=1 Tax=Sphingomonas sp. TaxID=28214 RepID=UPI003B00919A